MLGYTLKDSNCHFISLKVTSLNAFTTKKQTTKFSSAKFKKKSHPCHIIIRIKKKLEGKQCRCR